MSPRPTDPAVRDRLIATAARLLADEGPATLTTRRLAQEAGTSTMAVYTHFGGMEQLRVAVRREAFERLAAELAAVPRTGDPVTDLAAGGAAYVQNALAAPDLFRAVFLEAPIELEDVAAGFRAFEPLVEAVQRCLDAGRFAPAEPVGLALQLWTAVHGAVTLHLAALLPLEALPDHLAAMGRALFVGFGDDPEA